MTTKVVSSNPVHGEVYSIQHHGIKLIENPGPTLRQMHNGPYHNWYWSFTDKYETLMSKSNEYLVRKKDKSVATSLLVDCCFNKLPL
jgi:hypothetical protein